MRSCARRTARRLAEMHALGTTTVEIKSGYGLDVATEARILRIAGEFTAETTFLGAHVVPPEYADDRAGVRRPGVRRRCSSACAPLARWIDVFCDRGAFDADETRAGLVGGRRRRAPAAAPRQPARARAGRAARRRVRRRERRSLHAPHRRRHRRARRGRRGRDAAARRRVLDAARRTPTRAVCSTPASPSRSPPTATRAAATSRRCRW